MKVIVIDLDGTLTIDNPELGYADRQPRRDVIERLAFYREQGYRIVVQTARNMNSLAGNIGLINVHTLPTILDWLNRHGVPFDEVVLGKPWCGVDGFYVDDKAVRPDEFVALDPAALRRLVGAPSQE
jgi:capsule biosynthesis phosphatase